MPVRPAVLPDLVWLRQLYADMVEEQAPRYPHYDDSDLRAFTATLAGRLGTDPSLICWVAEDGPSIVGFVIGDVLTRPIGQPHVFAVCHWLYVVPSRRGEGLGRALTAGSTTEGISKGVEAVEIGAQPGDPQWARRGWQPTAVSYMLPADAVLASLAPTKGPPNGGVVQPEL